MNYYAAHQPLNFEIELIHSTEKSYFARCRDQRSEDVFKIIWMPGGELKVNDDKSFNFKNNFFFCFANSRDYHFQIDLPGEGFVISFTKYFLNIRELEIDLTCLSHLSDLFSRSSVITLGDDSADDIKELLNRMYKEYINSLAHKEALLTRYLKICLIYLFRHCEFGRNPVPKTRNMELVNQFIQAIENNYKDKKMVADYADLLFVTASYLNEVVKKVTGHTAGQHIRNRVVTEAKRMAASTNSSMKEIAYKLGFDDSAHFSKFFKSTSGNNFSEFKKQRTMVAFSA